MNNWLVVLITINFCIAVYCNIVFILYEVNMRRIRSEYQIEKVMSKPKSAFNTFLYVMLNFIPFYNMINAISFTVSVIMSLYKPSESDARIIKFYRDMKEHNLKEHKHKCECGGNLKSLNIMLLVDPPMYKHRCKKCGKEYNLKNNIPETKGE